MARSPHDALFRYTFGQPEHAAALLRAVLPPALTAALDWSSLTPLPGTRVDGRLRRRQTDLLYSVRSQRGEVLLHVLVEHSSRVDRWMVFRMLGYAVDIWRQLVRQRPAPRALPAIVPVVLHHGRRKWWAKTEFIELLEAPDEASAWLQPMFRHELRSLQDVPPTELQGLALTLLGKLTLGVMQYLPGARLPDAIRTIAEWSDTIRRVMTAPSGSEAIGALSEYVLLTTRVDPEALIQVVEREVNRRAGEIMQTAGAKLRREGKIEGKAEGKAEGEASGRVTLLVRQLTARFGAVPDRIIARLAAASADELDRFGVRLLDAGSLDQVFESE